MQQDHIYAKWREDKAAEPGFSRELISTLTTETEMIKHTTIDELDWYEKDCDTISAQFRRMVQK